VIRLENGKKEGASGLEFGVIDIFQDREIFLVVDLCSEKVVRTMVGGQSFQPQCSEIHNGGLEWRDSRLDSGIQEQKRFRLVRGVDPSRWKM